MCLTPWSFLFPCSYTSRLRDLETFPVRFYSIGNKHPWSHWVTVTVYWQIKQGTSCQMLLYSVSQLSFAPLCSVDLVASLYTNRKEAETEIKNYPIFHITLLKDKQSTVVLREENPSEWRPEQADQTPLLRLFAFLHISILVAFFHVGEQWLKWL